MSSKRKPGRYRAGLRSTKQFTDPDKAVEWVRELYDANTHYLTECFEAFAKGQLDDSKISACYPYIQIDVKRSPRGDVRRSYGYVSTPGVYRSSVTRPRLYGNYYREQLALLLQNHDKLKIEVGVSEEPIPLHFALGEHYHLESELSPEQIGLLPELFDLPDLVVMDDAIANGTHEVARGEARPLALFTAPRVDISLQRLKHYTSTSAVHFQNFIVFTNYQFYVDQFIRYGHEMMQMGKDGQEIKARSEYSEFVEPGDYVTYNENLNDGEKKTDGSPAARLPQMPAYHLKRPDRSGITLINIGVGPSNAKTITDHVAVLRPHAWLMLGHCAGLRNSQRLGDYVLAHAYVREDGVLDADLPVWVPIPALAEIQIALERAVTQVTGLGEYEMKKVMRTGTVATISDRNWELRDYRMPLRRLSQSRAIALEMESATVAANGFRFRVPYGSLLCVSDKPLHGQLKLPGMADSFYRDRVDQHLKIGILAMEKIREMGVERLHSRKLRSFSEVAFQ